MTEDGGDQCRGLDHVGNRPHEVARDLRQQALLLFDNRVGPIPGKAVLRFGTAETLVRLNVERLQNLIDGDLLQISRLRARHSR